MKNLSEPLKNFAKKISSHQTPTSVDEAKNNPKWVQAMIEKMEALLKNEAWILVPRLERQMIVECK